MIKIGSNILYRQMPRETLTPVQTPEGITRKLVTHLQPQLEPHADTPLEHEVEAVVDDIWSGISVPELRQFVAPLAEKALRDRRR